MPDNSVEQFKEILTFDQVLKEELKLIKVRRKAVPEEPGERCDKSKWFDQCLDDARKEALDQELVGLALSGGGIRSASFAIGIIQGLATLKLLGRFDYLSTVSGGGYAGGWLAAWLLREKNLDNVEKQLDPNRIRQAKATRPLLRSGQAVEAEPESIRHVRAYSSYLTPWGGLFSADSWTLLAIIIRNVLINFLIILPATLALVFFLRALAYFAQPVLNSGDELTRQIRHAAVMDAYWFEYSYSSWNFWWVLLSFVAGLGFLIYAFGVNRSALPILRDQENGAASGCPTPRTVYTKVVIPAILASLLLPLSMPGMLAILRETMVASLTERLGINWLIEQLGIKQSIADAGFLSLSNVMIHALFYGLMFWLISLGACGKLDGRKLRQRALAAGAVGGILLTFFEYLISYFFAIPHVYVVLAPPAALLVIRLSITAFVAMTSDLILEPEREWWGRLAGLLALYGFAWLIVTGSVLLVPVVLKAAATWVQASVSVGFLLSTLWGVVVGFSRNSGKPMDQASTATLVISRLTNLAPPVFLIGFLACCGLLAKFLLGETWGRAPVGASFWDSLVAIRGLPVAGVGHWLLFRSVLWTVLLALVAWLISTLVQSDKFTLQAMYANRLTRCFLGASRPSASWNRRWGQESGGRLCRSGAPTNAQGNSRDPVLFTGLDHKDDVNLTELKIGDQGYPGPHLLINATLNLVGSDDLTLRERLAEPFLISPLCCGTNLTGYVRVNKRAGQILTLGRAIATSGAAVDPNMGYYNSLPMSIMLTIFNARLGMWIENPSPRAIDPLQPIQRTRSEPWLREETRFASMLLTEMFGNTTAECDNVHISDGGHFDNLGVYELIRRRCKYVVAVDAGEDSRACSENLANLIRLCRIDLGIPIEVDTSCLRLPADSLPNGLTKQHVAIGRIRYDEVHQGATPGILVYIKISLTGDEPQDVLQFASTYTDFPHESTANQFFGEARFEAYRALGEHVARSVFERAVGDLRTQAGSPTSNRRLFHSLHEQWSEDLAVATETYLDSTKAWVTLQRDLRENPLLGRLSREIYPELALAQPVGWTEPLVLSEARSLERERAELHAVSEMLQVLEDVWVRLKLGRHHNLRLNRGWMNVFRRWTASKVFQRHWPILRPEFTELIPLLEENLQLKIGELRIEPVDIAESPLQNPLMREIHAAFLESWRGTNQPTLGEVQVLWDRINPTGAHVAWVALQPLPTDHGERSIPCGFLMLSSGAAPKDPKVRLTIWVSPERRSCGVGTKLLETFLAEWKQKSTQEGFPKTIVAQFPTIQSARTISLRERDFVATFLAFHGFRPRGDSLVSDPTSAVEMELHL